MIIETTDSIQYFNIFSISRIYMSKNKRYLLVYLDNNLISFNVNEIEISISRDEQHLHIVQFLRMNTNIKIKILS